jgi:hypothetical protein
VVLVKERLLVKNSFSQKPLAKTKSFWQRKALAKKQTRQNNYHTYIN